MTLNVSCKQCGMKFKIEVRDAGSHPVEVDECPWCLSKKEAEGKFVNHKTLDDVIAEHYEKENPDD